MKKIFTFLLALTIGISAAWAQTKTVAQVVTELCTSSNYPTTVGTYISVQVILGGHGFSRSQGIPASSFGSGFEAITSANIKNKTSGNPPMTINYKAVECFGSTPPSFIYNPVRGGKYNGARFKLTLSNGPIANISAGGLQIVYSDGTLKNITLPTNLSVYGTSINTGYTITGKVTGEVGDEDIIIIIRPGYIGG